MTAPAGRSVVTPAGSFFRKAVLEEAVSETLIELRDITKSYGRVYALGGVNLALSECRAAAGVKGPEA